MWEVLVLSTWILRAVFSVFCVPSGHTHTKNLSTHLQPINHNPPPQAEECSCSYLTFLMMFPQVTITFSGSLLEGWVTVGLA